MNKLIIMFTKKMNVNQLRKLFIGIFNYLPHGAQEELIKSILAVYFPTKHIKAKPYTIHPRKNGNPKKAA
jgi:predicted metalloenzyme YecM